VTTDIYLDNNEWNYLFSHGRYSEKCLASIVANWLTGSQRDKYVL
jgi:hypothetical protein